MTNLQEAKLAREAEICYVTIAMVTDYDCWHPDHDAVTVTDIIANLMKNAANACKVVAEAVARMPAERACKCGSALAHALITDRKHGSRSHAQETGADRCEVLRVKRSRRRFSKSCIAGKPPKDLPHALIEEPCSRGAVRRAGGGSCRPLRARAMRCLRAVVFAGHRARFRRRRGRNHFPLRVRAARASGDRRAEAGPRALPRNPGRRCRRYQRAAGRREAPVSQRADRVCRTRAKTTNCSPAIRAWNTRAWIIRAAACASASPRRSELHALAADADCLVIDPDSRLTQLGLLPVCPEERYRLFESRAYGGGYRSIAAGTGRAMGARDVRRCGRQALHRASRTASRDSRASPSAWAWARTRPSGSPIRSRSACSRCWPRAACRSASIKARAAPKRNA